MKAANGHGAAPHTLSIDVGGTGIKASVLDAKGHMMAPRMRVPTPYPCTPHILLDAIAGLVPQLPAFDRISLGFPGVVRDGRVITAPHFGAEPWYGVALAEVLSRRFGKPARILNDAEVQGLDIIAGKGLEVVLTLGTGVGSAIFSAGMLAPHLELAHQPIRKRKSYNEYVGDAARRAVGDKKWNRRVLKMIGAVEALLHYDVLYLGGGNSANVALELPKGVRIASNDAGITGGIWLWDDKVWRAVPGGAAACGEEQPPAEASA